MQDLTQKDATQKTNTRVARFFINKIVRDNTNRILDQSGVKYQINNKLTKEERIHHYIVKIHEEVQEVQNLYTYVKDNICLSLKQFITELVDVIDVIEKINSIVNHNGKHIIFLYNEQLNNPSSISEMLDFMAQLSKNIIDNSSTSNEEAILIQLQDIMTCVHNLMITMNITWSPTIGLMVKKKYIRGKFRKNMFLESIDIPEGHRLFNKYKKKFFNSMEWIAK